jgi:hypothetical protein
VKTKPVAGIIVDNFVINSLEKVLQF